VHNCIDGAELTTLNFAYRPTNDWNSV